MRLLPSPELMLDTVFARLAALKLPTDLECDHICYRVATQERYEELQALLAGEGVLESEAMIAGRPISTFRLYTPYFYKGRSIPALELPAPKPGSAYKEGWEHAEFVTPQPLELFILQHAQATFDIRAMGKGLNPEVGVRLTPDYQAKFHNQPLLEVIRLEKKMGLA